MATGEVISSVVAGALGGVAAATLAQWAQWAVETRRRRDEQRLSLVQDARALLEEWHFTRPRSLNRDFINDIRYERLRPHLSVRTKSLLDEPTIVVEDNGNPDDSSTTYTRGNSSRAARAGALEPLVATVYVTAAVPKRTTDSSTLSGQRTLAHAVVACPESVGSRSHVNPSRMHGSRQ